MSSHEHTSRDEERALDAASHAPPASSEIVVSQNGPAVLPDNLPITDDTPTVISKVIQGQGRAEEALAGDLRGQHLAHFELLEPIGVGGMAAVIRARDLQLDRLVALKILPRHMAENPELVRRFHQEARAAAKLDHENIARVFYCGEDQGTHFIAFEFVEGENLRALMERRGRIPVDEAIGYILQVALGLAHAAARGVVHRDIKPSNIIIGLNGRAKVVDMGLARSLESQPDGALTHSGITLGTFDYISPEQALEPRDADVCSDIYSLGCTFYHILTGQAPVPEGTAAKKLHHHQHVDPVDPRQLNPEIPDDVAALLSRMMAKDRSKRYQRPEDLVRHLCLLARKLGAIAEIPDQALLVDAPLPAPPRIRPLTLVLSAAAALAAFVLFLGPGSWPATAPSNGGSSQGRDESWKKAEAPDVAADKIPASLDKSDEQASMEPVQDEPFLAKDAKSLAEFVNKAQSGHIVLANDIQLTRETLLKFDGGDLLLEGSDPKKPTVIDLSYDLDHVGEVSWTGMTIHSAGLVRIRGVRFRLNAHQADIDMAALALESGRLNVENCEFDQIMPAGPEIGRVYSIIVSGPNMAGDKPVLLVRNSYFSRGQHSLKLLGDATFNQCVFSPHLGSLIDLENAGGPMADSVSRVSLSSCSALVSGGSIFRLDGSGRRSLEVRNCIFSRPESQTSASPAAALIEEMGELGADFQFTGFHNCYHNLRSIWMRTVGRDITDSVEDLEHFKVRIGIEDERSIQPTASPWENGNPLRLLALEPKKALRIAPDQPDLRLIADAAHAIGVEQSLWGRIYDPPLPSVANRDTETSTGHRIRIVDPRATYPPAYVYRTLRQALEEAAPGDEIQLKHTGTFRMEPVQIEKSGMDVTIKPYPGCHPVLTCGPTTDPDVALFRLHDGQLTLEGLEFRLAPDRELFKAQSVIALMGDGQCIMRDCVATLEESSYASLSVATLTDPSDVIKMNPQSATPQDPHLAFQNCFVRGMGNLVMVRASRPLQLHVEQSLIALDGSLFSMEGNQHDPTTRLHAEISFRKVTAYLTENLIALRAFKDLTRNSKGLVATQVRSASGCLFVSAASKPLVHLEGIDSEEQMRGYFSWLEGRRNTYGNFEQFLDLQPWADRNMMTPTVYGQRQWELFSHETEDRFERSHLAMSPAGETQLSHITLTSFKPRAESGSSDCGADIERLPRPRDENAFSLIPAESTR